MSARQGKARRKAARWLLAVAGTGALAFTAACLGAAAERRWHERGPQGVHPGEPPFGASGFRDEERAR